MDPIDVGNIITWTISLAALTLAVVSFTRQHGLQKRLAAIEEARREEELGSRLRAEVTAGFESRPTSSGAGWFFVVRNLGPATARGVGFDLTATEGDVPGLMTQGHAIPIPSLDADQEYAILAAIVLGTAPAVNVRMTWEDETGPREKRLTLPVFG